MSFIDMSGPRTLSAGQRNPNIQIHRAPASTQAAPGSSQPSTNSDSVQISSGANEDDANIGSLAQGLADAFGDDKASSISKSEDRKTQAAAPKTSKAGASSNGNSSSSNSSSTNSIGSSGKSASASASKSDSSSKSSSKSDKK